MAGENVDRAEAHHLQAVEPRGDRQRPWIENRECRCGMGQVLGQRDMRHPVTGLVMRIDGLAGQAGQQGVMPREQGAGGSRGEEHHGGRAGEKTQAGEGKVKQ